VSDDAGPLGAEPDHRRGVASRNAGDHFDQRLASEDAMATHENGQIVETPTEARSAEPGPSVLALLAASTGLAVLVLGGMWFAFFRG
jgi:hypothetical protein